ncbi:MAG: maleylpyruvate isomerase family mycothiol-dependent enzyme [Pseudonocardiaceae bacterium]|nr:maleylpyruvate isomerase family mycothiol-dependent enzyme [Pseudonocardiaceae bacterium]
MHPVEHAKYCTVAETEAGLLRAAALAVAPDTPVPTCPDWTVQRLLSHCSRVFAMVTGVLAAADPSTPPSRVSGPPGDLDAIVAGYDERLAEMVAALRATDPAAPAWHFSPTAPKTAAFWARRMAHETTVHRLDAQGAAGEDTGVDPDSAADGIDEVLTRLLQRWTDEWPSAEHSGTVLYHAADAGRAWTVRLVPGQLPQTAQEVVAEPDASVIGLADAVFRAAWGARRTPQSPGTGSSSQPPVPAEPEPAPRSGPGGQQVCS